MSKRVLASLATIPFVVLVAWASGWNFGRGAGAGAVIVLSLWSFLACYSCPIWRHSDRE